MLQLGRFEGAAACRCSPAVESIAVTYHPRRKRKERLIIVRKKQRSLHLPCRVIDRYIDLFKPFSAALHIHLNWTLVPSALFPQWECSPIRDLPLLARFLWPRFTVSGGACGTGSLIGRNVHGKCRHALHLP